MYQKSAKGWMKHFDFILLDLLCLQASFCFAYFIRFSEGKFPYFVSEYRSIITIISILLFASALFLNNYSDILKRGHFVEFKKVVFLGATTLVLTSLYLFSVHLSETYSRILVYLTLGIFILLDLIFRTIYKSILKNKNGSKTNSISLIIVGDEKDVKQVIDDIKKNNNEYVIKGVVLYDDRAYTKYVLNVPVIAPFNEAAIYICRHWIDEVLVCPSNKGVQPGDFLDRCAEMGITVHMLVNIEGVEKSKQFVEEIGGRTVLTTAYGFISFHQAFLKRFFDIIGGFIGLAVTLLIGLVIGPIIYIQSPGPIIFKQNRIGRNGKKFQIYKFRSMYPDAERRKVELSKQNRNKDGMMFKIDFDPRVIGNRIMKDGTRKMGVGEFIRKTSLDEFPQFFNVLKGDMSLVGTRPPTVDEWEKYAYHHRARLSIKPGVTGMWQISGRSDITNFEEVVKLDTDYIKNFSLGMDCKILLKTIVVLVKGKGAY